MGEPLLILSLAVIIIGGIGSVRGAFIAAIIVGLQIRLGGYSRHLCSGCFLIRRPQMVQDLHWHPCWYIP